MPCILIIRIVEFENNKTNHTQSSRFFSIHLIRKPVYMGCYAKWISHTFMR